MTGRNVENVENVEDDWQRHGIQMQMQMQPVNAGAMPDAKCKMQKGKM